MNFKDYLDKDEAEIDEAAPKPSKKYKDMPLNAGQRKAMQNAGKAIGNVLPLIPQVIKQMKMTYGNSSGKELEKYKSQLSDMSKFFNDF